MCSFLREGETLQHLAVDRVQRALAGQHAGDLLAVAAPAGNGLFVGLRGDVGCHRHVRHREQRVARVRWLLLQDVQAGTG